MTVVKLTTTVKKRCSLMKRSVEKRRKVDVNELVSELQLRLRIEKCVDRAPMVLAQSKRKVILQDISIRGYHLYLRRGIPRALLVPCRKNFLVDHLSGRTVNFRDHNRQADRNCLSDDEDLRRSHSPFLPARSLDI